VKWATRSRQPYKLPRMLRVGIVGWRGMVGSVLVQRMREERDFDHFEPMFFSTSQAGGKGPSIGKDTAPVKDAKDLAALKALPVIISCQGAEYTNEVHAELRKAGWKGYWIDAASALRMKDHAVIILDPVNMPVIKKAQAAGIKDYIGGNCTVSLMLMGMAGLFQRDEIEWMTTMTYQAASGAGAAHLRELAEQMARIGQSATRLLEDPAASALDIDRAVTEAVRSPGLPKANFEYPLAASLLPWVDIDLGNGQSREEWKGQAETNKILDRNGRAVPVDGICVRVGAMRCHSQALTIKLRRALPLDEIEGMIAEANDWVKLVPNRREESLAELTPAAVTGKLSVPVGRLRKLPMGDDYLAAFTVGDQLLWGAAEPLRRMLRILLEAGLKA
jgi:aspartate-semialdehyde dehydrogenase